MSEMFKDVSELEQFYKNLGIEYRFSCYYEKNSEGCHLLGDYLSQIKSDFVRSAKVFKDNCDQNKFGRSCTQFGTYLLYSKGCEKDVQKAVDYFCKGCDLNDAEGCFYSGQFLSGTDSNYSEVKSDIKKSLEHLEKGCDLTKNAHLAAECCFTASSFYLFGKNGCNKDTKKAFELSEKGCHLDHMQSCSNLSLMYLLGEGTQQNTELANKYRDKAIDMMQQINNYKSIDTQRT